MEYVSALEQPEVEDLYGCSSEQMEEDPEEIYSYTVYEENQDTCILT
jgi:hypothetical protein